jgi:hypothetical protein
MEAMSGVRNMSGTGLSTKMCEMSSLVPYSLIRLSKSTNCAWTMVEAESRRRERQSTAVCVGGGGSRRFLGRTSPVMGWTASEK